MPLCALTSEHESHLWGFGRMNRSTDTVYQFLVEFIDCRSKAPCLPTQSTPSVRQSVPQIIDQALVVTSTGAVSVDGAHVSSITFT